MAAYTIKRLLQVIPTLVGITLLVFVMLRLSGDPIQAYLGSEEAELAMLTDAQVEAIRAKLGLDKPIPIQYLIYVGNALRGDFGASYIYQGRPALEPFIIGGLCVTWQVLVSIFKKADRTEEVEASARKTAAHYQQQ